MRVHVLQFDLVHQAAHLWKVRLHCGARFERVVRRHRVAHIHLTQAPMVVCVNKQNLNSVIKIEDHTPHGARRARVTQAAYDADVAAVLQPANAEQQHRLHLRKTMNELEYICIHT